MVNNICQPGTVPVLLSTVLSTGSRRSLLIGIMWWYAHGYLAITRYYYFAHSDFVRTDVCPEYPGLYPGIRVGYPGIAPPKKNGSTPAWHCVR